MLRDITIGQYYPADSPIHRLDPRTKILSTILYIILIFTLNKMIGYGLIAVFILSVIKLSKVPAKFILKGLRPILLIIIFAFVINMLMTPGETMYKLWIFDITKEGFRQAFFMVFRLIFLIIGTSVLTLTTSPILLTDGIEKLLNVFKKVGVPAHELAMMMTIALRFIPTLLEETDKIMKAQMARGADFETGNLVNRAKSLIPILVPLFISAFRRADDLAMAMEARCYRGGENRTRMKVLKYSQIDIGALVFMIILTGAHISIMILA